MKLFVPLIELYKKYKVYIKVDLLYYLSFILTFLLLYIFFG